MINCIVTITTQKVKKQMMFSSTLATLRDIAQELIELPTQSVGIMLHDEVYQVYPGNFSELANKQSSRELYQRRIQLWKDAETDEPKDEVLDNETYAGNRIKALILGKMARKNVAYQHTVQHWKRYHLDQAYKRVGEKLIAEKQTQDKLSRLENENARLKQELQNLTIKCHIDDIQHTRQIHHLRTKVKLISDS